MPRDFTVSVYERAGAEPTYTLTVESTTITDRGGGMYDLSFTPSQSHAAHWFIFQVAEPAYVNSALLIHTFTVVRHDGHRHRHRGGQLLHDPRCLRQGAARVVQRRHDSNRR